MREDKVEPGIPICPVATPFLVGGTQYSGNSLVISRSNMIGCGQRGISAHHPLYKGCPAASFFSPSLVGRTLTPELRASPRAA